MQQYLEQEGKVADVPEQVQEQDQEIIPASKRKRFPHYREFISEYERDTEYDPGLLEALLRLPARGGGRKKHSGKEEHPQKVREEEQFKESELKQPGSLEGEQLQMDQEEGVKQPEKVADGLEEMESYDPSMPVFFFEV